MKRFPKRPPIILGIILLSVVTFGGGWVVLDKVLKPIYLTDGTRTVYQQDWRVNAMEQPLVYVGSEQCGGCHPSVKEEWLQSSHKTVACEVCHGPGSTYVETGIPIPVNDTINLCLTCHAQSAAKPETFPQPSIEAMSSGLACIQCHNPMHPDVGNTPQIPHRYWYFPEISCLACHGSQGASPAPANHLQRPDETCIRCHSEIGQ